MTLPIKFPIKFRGRFWNKNGDLIALGDPKDGDFIYGGYARMTLRLDVGEGDYIIDKEGEALLIYPDSVKQLVGYDKNGKELYAGDPVADQYGEGWANINALVGHTGGAIGKVFEDYELKESADNDVQ